MISPEEERALHFLLHFVRQSGGFRTIPLQEVQSNLITELKEEGVFALFKGVYQKNDVAIGLVLNYDIKQNARTGDISLFYVLPCNVEMAFAFVPETTADRFTKQIGLKIEIEVDNKEIDDHYLINSNDPDKLTLIASEDPLKSFLVKHIGKLEQLTLKDNLLKYQRLMIVDEETVGKIEEDMNVLLNIINKLEPKKEEAEEEAE